MVDCDGHTLCTGDLVDCRQHFDRPVHRGHAASLAVGPRPMGPSLGPLVPGDDGPRSCDRLDGGGSGWWDRRYRRAPPPPPGGAPPPRAGGGGGGGGGAATTAA